MASVPQWVTLLAPSALKEIGNSILMHLIFFKHLVTCVKNVAKDTPTPQAPEELQLYNPPKTGVAYYFTNSGAKIRNARKFSIDGKAMGKDDHSSTAACRIYYPKSSKIRHHIYVSLVLP